MAGVAVDSPTRQPRLPVVTTMTRPRQPPSPQLSANPPDICEQVNHIASESRRLAPNNRTRFQGGETAGSLHAECRWHSAQTWPERLFCPEFPIVVNCAKDVFLKFRRQFTESVRVQWSGHQAFDQPARTAAGHAQPLNPPISTMTDCITGPVTDRTGKAVFMPLGTDVRQSPSGKRSPPNDRQHDGP